MLMVIGAYSPTKHEIMVVIKKLKKNCVQDYKCSKISSFSFLESTCYRMNL